MHALLAGHTLEQASRQSSAWHCATSRLDQTRARGIADGLTNRQIVDRLSAERTADAHELGCASRAQIAAPVQSPDLRILAGGFTSSATLRTTYRRREASVGERLVCRVCCRLALRLDESKSNS